MGILRAAILLPVLWLTACASSPSGATPSWDVTQIIDPMTGEKSAWVVPSSAGRQFLMHAFGLSTARMVSPAFALKHGQPCAGMKSVGDYNIPVGSIQLRVDEGELYSIGPTDDIPMNATSLEAAMLAGQAIAAATIRPYTLTCGVRGAAIVSQIKAGHLLRARQSAGGEGTSATMEIEINSDLLNALAEAGL